MCMHTNTYLQYIYISISIYLYIYICICIYIYTYICIYLSIYLSIYIYLSIFVSIYLYMYRCHVDVCTSVVSASTADATLAEVGPAAAALIMLWSWDTVSGAAAVGPAKAPSATSRPC